jgi:hypothetical protein
MRKTHLKISAKVAGVVALAGSTLTLGSAIVTTAPAHADPAFTYSLVGVGSDTTQDLFNRFSGAIPYPPNANTTFSIPLDSGNASGSGHATISSFDAIPAGGSPTDPGCITTKLKGGSFSRPNGSGAGVHALSRAVDGGTWQASTGSTCTPHAGNVSGQIDFARSSREPNTTTTNGPLTWIPFAEDAIGVAVAPHGSAIATPLTTATLNTLYTSSTGTFNFGSGITLKACLPQANSGTRASFESKIGVTDAQAATAATAAGCNGAQAGIEENNANELQTFAASQAAGVEPVIGFSSASWIAQANGKSPDLSATGRSNGVDLVAQNDPAPGPSGKPYSGTAPNLAPVVAYYASSYGRRMFVVVNSNDITGFPGNPAIQDMFGGGVSTPAICSATALSIEQQFGFLAMTTSQGTCGTTTITSALDQ